MKKKTMFRLDVVCLMWIKKKPNLSFEHIFLLVLKKGLPRPEKLEKKPMRSFKSITASSLIHLLSTF